MKPAGLREAARELCIAVEELEGTPIEYSLGMKLSNAVKQSRAALAQPDEGIKLATMVLQQRTGVTITSLDLIAQARKVLNSKPE